GIGRLDRRDARRDGVSDGDIAGAFGAQYVDADHRRAIEARERARLGHGVDDGTQVLEPHLAAGRKPDPHGGQVGDRLGASESTDRLVTRADFGPAARQIDIAAANLPADIERGQTDGLQAYRVEAHADLAIDAANPLDTADTANALQTAHDHVLHEP